MVRIELPVSFEFDQSMMDIEFDPSFNVEFDAEENFSVEGYPNGHYMVTDRYVRLLSLDLCNVK